MSDNYRIIGLTGGIGAGKSAASVRFSRLGAALIDADVLARAALDMNGCCYHEVAHAFGDGILRRDGSIDRSKLAKLVFSNEQHRERLNAIVHPRVIADMLLKAREIVDADKTAIVVLDVPLLFECGMERMVDRTLLVYADEALRISRVVARDGCASLDAAARIRAQMPQADKMERADYCLNNNGPIEALYGQTDALYQLFRSKLR